MALMKGKLFTGLLFAGALLGAGEVDIPVQPPVYGGGGGYYSVPPRIKKKQQRITGVAETTQAPQEVEGEGDYRPAKITGGADTAQARQTITASGSVNIEAIDDEEAMMMFLMAA